MLDILILNRNKIVYSNQKLITNLYFSYVLNKRELFLNKSAVTEINNIYFSFVF